MNIIKFVVCMVYISFVLLTLMDKPERVDQTGFWLIGMVSTMGFIVVVLSL